MSIYITMEEFEQAIKEGAKKPMTEEERRKGRELTEKIRSLSKEERLKMFKGTPDDDLISTEKDK